ncbi:uncharacterized protein LOC132756835 [Ruditapes philippinarum]|uniref:uncharacterized protein LOC132756835 n=1 Tax=Ruditapes philippinarum TaxID=129788 RepID=UPI00295B7E9F|nr:uncharacterized protein LOC132756835 [Ruditapes philippinarum]
MNEMESFLFYFFLFLSIKLSCGGGDDDSIDTAPCEPGQPGLYPHAECQMYYNCSMKNTDTNFRYWLGDHLVECNYPYLYSISYQSCQPHKNVQCGNRIEYKHGCEYHNNQCNGPHCRSCSFQYSNCTVQNGVLPMESMPNSPYFGICDDWRFTKMTCPDGMIFDQASKECV